MVLLIDCKIELPCVFKYNWLLLKEIGPLFTFTWQLIQVKFNNEKVGQKVLIPFFFNCTWYVKELSDPLFVKAAEIYPERGWSTNTFRLFMSPSFNLLRGIKFEFISNGKILIWATLPAVTEGVIIVANDFELRGPGRKLRL